MTIEEIENLIDKWLKKVGNISFSYDMCSNQEFATIIRQGNSVIPVVLNRLRDESPFLGYQFLLKAISGEDYWQGENMPKGYRSINVAESAKLWLEWGQLKGLIDDIVPKWDRKTEYEPK